MKNVSKENFVDFQDFLLRFQGVIRLIPVPQREVNENDAEHSFSLAMFCWYIIEIRDLKLDINKVFKYSLAHDLVEAYAGDTPEFADSDAKKQKTELEAQAVQTIADRFPEFTDLSATIRAYEEQEDAESNFVYAMDKLMPVIMLYLQDGNLWKELEIDFEQWKESIIPKVKRSQEVYDILQEFITDFESSPGHYFHVKNG